MAQNKTYLFGKNTTVDDLLRNAYLRAGMKPDMLVPLEAQDSLFALNLELSVWMGRRLDLWQIQRQMFQLYSGQSIYTLPSDTVRVEEVVAIRPERLNVGGTPFASDGTAANPFLPGNTSGCIQTTANGYIGYDYGLLPPPSVFYVGIQALVPNQEYTIDIDYSFDTPNWDYQTANWITVFSSGTQAYPNTQIQWLVVENTLNARAWRIRETRGAVLNVQQLYFSRPLKNLVSDITLSSSSREDYMSLANKLMPSNTPGQFYLNQKDTCSLVLWPVPTVLDNQVNAVLYTSYKYLADINSLTQRLDIPPIFYDAVCAGLAVRLASMNPSYDLARLQYLESKALSSYQTAAATNYEDVPLSFSLDLGGYS